MPMMYDQIQQTFGVDLSLAILRARRLKGQARRQDFIDLLDLYNSAQVAILREDIEAAFEDVGLKKALNSCLRVTNLTKWVVVEGSRVVDEPPVVKVSGLDGAQQEELTDLWSTLDDLGKLWVAGADVERYANLVNNVMVQPALREIDGLAHLSWDIYPPDRYAVAQQWASPDVAEAVALYYMLEDDEAAHRTLERGYQTWTRETVRVFDTKNNDVTEVTAKKAGQTQGIGDNPYKDLFGIPAVVFRIGHPLFGEYYCPPAVELGNANRQLNLQRTQRQLIERMQGFGQLVVINASEKDREKLFVGATRTINIVSDKDRPGDAKFINPNAPLKELRDSESKLIQEVATEWGLNAADFEVFESGSPRQPASGKAKRIDNQRLLKRTRTNEAYLRPSFVELIKETLLMVKYWDAKGVKLPGVDASLIPESMDQIVVELTFAQEPSIQTPEDFALFQNRARVGLDCYADEYMQEHPETNSRDDAEKAMQEAIESNDRVQQASIMKQMTAALLAAQGGLAPAPGTTAAPTGAPAAGAGGAGSPTTPPAKPGEPLDAKKMLTAAASQSKPPEPPK